MCCATPRPGGPRSSPRERIVRRSTKSARNRSPMFRSESVPNYLISQLDQLPSTPCPCGLARRAFAGSKENAASVHLVEIQKDSRAHYHRKMTEIYVILEGQGQIELDG